jgi:hypothetical protein
MLAEMGAEGDQGQLAEGLTCAAHVEDPKRT